MAVLRRALWALGLVKVKVTPRAASLAEGGKLALTVAFQPRPPRVVSLAREFAGAGVVHGDAVIHSKSESASVETTVLGAHEGATTYAIRVLPTARAGRSVQKVLQRVGEWLGLGRDTVKLTVIQPPIFVIAPHPDDEALIASGVIARAVEHRKPVKVVVVTNGDHLRDKKNYGIKRQAESVAAMEKLGLQAADVIFLGYPGDVRGLLHIMNMYLDEASAYVSAAGSSSTYGEHGLGSCDFHSWLTGKPASYNAVHLHNDLAALIEAFRPRDIYTVSRFDEHPDHRAVNYLTLRALQRLRRQVPDYTPTLRTTIVHEPSHDAYDDFWERDKPPPPIGADFGPDDFWPAPLEDGAVRHPTALAKFTPPLHLSRTSLMWNQVERLAVPASMQTADLGVNLKYQVLQTYETQPLRYLAPFCKQEEIFWREEVPEHELLALRPIEMAVRKDQARVMTVTLVNPATSRIAIALESSAPEILAVPPAVIVEAGAVTAAFAVRGVLVGKATVTATLGTPRELLTATVTDAAPALREAISIKKAHCA